VRNWATFAIGQYTDLDSPDLREALLARTKDEDAEVRGEALIGLARRRDARALPLVRAELDGEFHGGWAVEAAEILAEPGLGPILESLYERIDPADREFFRQSFRHALDACRAKP
jgi:HEAT repeat protein